MVIQNVVGAESVNEPRFITGGGRENLLAGGGGSEGSGESDGGASCVLSDRLVGDFCFGIGCDEVEFLVTSEKEYGMRFSFGGRGRGR